jgi:hypothetical protein
MERFNRKDLTIESLWTDSDIRLNNSDEIWRFRKNLGVSELAGHPDLRSQIYCTVYYSPGESPDPSAEKAENPLHEFEDIDVPEIERASNSIHVASVLRDGVKDYIFYSADPERFLDEVNKKRVRIERCKVELEHNLDPTWKVYREFPSVRPKDTDRNR